MADYREKIQKLLALAESDNEHEAKAALLKAQELMAEYKITEIDLVEKMNKNVKRVKSSVTYSTYRDPWIISLSAVISENYCCKNFIEKEWNKKTRYQCFVGLEDDVEICNTIFEYAVDSIHMVQKKLTKGYTGQEKKQVADSYANGFIRGLRQAYDAQKKSNEAEWGLVMVVPKEVEDDVAGMVKKAFRATNYGVRGDYFNRGMDDGKNFDPGRKVSGNREAAMAICG